ncbi:putative RNA and SrmB- binding site of polymerase A [compost metagenome]
MAACAALAEGVEQLSAERVSKELLKLLAAPDPRHAVRLMDQAGVLGRVLPSTDLGLLEAMTGVSSDPVLRLSALLPGDPARVAEVAGRLRLSNAQRERLVEAASGETQPELTVAQARTIIYRDGRQAFEDRVMRAWAAGGDAEASRRLLALAQAWSRPSLPVGGRDLARLGLKPGPETGRVLKAFEAGWIADDFPDHGHEERLRALLPPA